MADVQSTIAGLIAADGLAAVDLFEIETRTGAATSRKLTAAQLLAHIEAVINLSNVANGTLPDGRLAGTRLATDCKTVSNWDAAADTGFYKCASNSTNAPATGALFGFTTRYDVNAIAQYVTEAGKASPATYRRLRIAGAWQAWERVYKTAAEISAALPTRLGGVAATVTDWNAATSSGWYMGNGAANAPEAAKWFMGETINHGAAGYCVQTVFEFTTMSAADNKSWRRHQLNGTWSAWYRLYSTAGEISSLGAGGLKLLQTVTLANTASVDFTLPAGYASFVFEFDGLLPSLDGANVLGMRFSTDGGATFDATSNYVGIGMLAISGGFDRYGGGANSFAQLNGNGIQKGDGSLGATGRVQLVGHASSTKRTQLLSHFAHIRNDGAFAWSNGGAQIMTASVTNAVRILLSGVASSVMQSGTIRMYGVVA